METSLHRQLKRLYAGPRATLEVPIDGYRIDAVADGQLIEIQHGPLIAIRRKVRDLVERHRVLLVKPIVARKMLVKRARRGKNVTRRLSPKRGTILDLFDELVYFTKVFPHPNLTLETPLVEIEEWRAPPRRRSRKPYRVEDQKLLRLLNSHRFCTAADLLPLLPDDLPMPFHTGHLAQALSIERWVAQRIAYCLRCTGAIVAVGKQRNAHLYVPANECRPSAAG